MHRNVAIEQSGRVNAAEVVKANAAETDELGTPGKFLREVARVARLRKVERLAGIGQAGKMRALAGNLTRPRSTSALSGIPANRR
ncbi:hypothetical protein XH80_26855 [Bradyrhizobium sp. CCBAU 45384]|nr:hypothetical protein [Bradyrhizobium sp. CCBAU 45384]